MAEGQVKEKKNPWHKITDPWPKKNPWGKKFLRQGKNSLTYEKPAAHVWSKPYMIETRNQKDKGEKCL